MLEAILLYLALLVSVAFALTAGERPERLGAAWLLLNVVIHAANEVTGAKSTTMHLITDGIYATGLLPLAMFYVSWWVGIQTFIAAAGFGLQAFYLLTDHPTDYAFLQVSNTLFAAGVLNLFVATAGCTWKRQRLAGAAVKAAA